MPYTPSMATDGTTLCDLSHAPGRSKQSSPTETMHWTSPIGGIWGLSEALTVSVLVLLIGCFRPPPVEYVALNENYQRPAWLDEEGENSIEGTALLRTVGGEARTCAALDVWLIPVTTYAKKRMLRLYGNLQSGYRSADSGELRFVPEFTNYHDDGFMTRCDAQGRFEFDDLPDGEWFITASVYWGVPVSQYNTSIQGGALMQHVRVSGGRTERVVLAR